MAHIAEFEAKSGNEKLTSRRPLSKHSATHFGRPTSRFGKRNRISSQVHAAFKALRSKEQQMAVRLATAQQVEAELDDRHQALNSFEQRIESRLDELNQRIPALDLTAELTQSVAETILASLNAKLDSLVHHKLELRQLQDQVESETNQQLEQSLANASEELTLCRMEADDLRRTVDSQELEICQLRQDLADLRELLTNNNTASDSRSSNANEEIFTLRESLRNAQETVESLRAQLASADANRIDDYDSYGSSEELDLLRRQNADLSAELSKLQTTSRLNAPHLNRTNESMTWEERKRLIIQQLDDDADAASGDGHHKSEVSDILATTQAEIDRRDAEIAELRSIIDQQSNASAGVAIGAAAIAQMIDSDELIQQEREKLRTIQKEWEDKLRQAEIELSLERAKLARERSTMEERLRDAAVLPKPEPRTTEGGKPVRKWLEHLGLKEK
jgi:hypothetical protein